MPWCLGMLGMLPMTDESQYPEPKPTDGLRPPAPTGNLSSQELRDIAQEIASSYPPPRLGTEVVLLEVNPHRAHAYWNIDVEDYRSAAAACGDPSPPLLLRLHDVTGIEFDGSNSHSYFDLQVQGLQGHWYVDLWKDGRTHVAELGLRRADGRLEILARSNPVSTPPATESPYYHTQAVNTAQPDSALRLVDLADPGLSPETLDVETGAEIELNPPPLSVVPAPDPGGYRAPEAAPEKETDAGVPLEPSRAPPEPEDSPRAFPLPPGGDTRPTAYPAVFPEARETDFPLQPEDNGQIASDAPEIASEPPARTAASDQAAIEAAGQDLALSEDERRDWPSADDLARFVSDSRWIAPPPTSSDLSAAEPNSTAPAQTDRLAPVQPETGAHPASPAPIAQPTNADVQTAAAPTEPPPPPASLPLENYVALSSAEHGRRQVALEVNVELHIYGRAKPGTEVSFYGQPVPLRPDGSFSLRKPLPHGAVVLPLLAVDPSPAQ